MGIPKLSWKGVLKMHHTLKKDMVIRIGVVKNFYVVNVVECMLQVIGKEQQVSLIYIGTIPV